MASARARSSSRRAAVDPGDDDAVHRGGGQLARPGAGGLLLERLELLLEVPDLGPLALDGVDDLVGADAEHRGDLGQAGLVVAEHGDGREAGDGLEPAQVGADRALADDLDRADVAERGRRGCRRTARWSAGPASSTRTMSPYLSPKKAMAPISVACSLVVS